MRLSTDLLIDLSHTTYVVQKQMVQTTDFKISLRMNFRSQQTCINLVLLKALVIDAKAQKHRGQRRVDLLYLHVLNPHFVFHPGTRRKN